MWNISEEWAVGIFLVGFILSFFGVICLVILIYQNTKFDILKRKVAKKEEEINTLKRRLKEEKRKSGIDELTGIYNRRLLRDKAERLIAWADRFKAPLSFLFLDLDNFKCINDNHGHGKGDEVLKEVAAGIRDISRNTDSYFRLGGDEFFMILPGTDAEGAIEFSERLEKKIESISQKLEIPTEMEFGSSIGMVSHSKGVTFEEIIENSDRHMYAVKERRKKR